MDTLTRLRHGQKRIVKAQRRVWLVQAAFWPAVLLAGAAVVAAAIIRYRGRDTGLPTPVDGLPHL